MAGPWEAYQTDKKPSVKERAVEANIGRSEAATQAAQAAAAASGAAAQERNLLTPARQRKAAADARTAEVKAEQAEIALEKARNLISSMPAPKEVPAAREILLREIRNLAQARELSETMFSASGIGFDMLSGIGGSPAEQVLGLLNPILANEAFEALSKMRAESPTGGALGNVTERELELLKSTGGYVPPTAGDEQFQQGIDDLIKHRIKTLSKLGVFPQDLAASLGPRYVEKFAPEVEGYRFSERDEVALDNYVKQNIPKGTFDPADFAALMGQAYYNATGNQPDENYIKSAFEGGIEIADEGREGLGGLYYEQSDEDTRKRFIGSIGELAPDETTLGEALGGAAINFIPSTFELAGDTVRALTLDLPDTLDGIVDIVAGATGLSKDDTSWEALKDYYTDRYGSYEGFKKALREDPASIAADVAGVFTGGATILAKTAGTAGRVGKIAALSDAARKAEGFSRAVAKIDPLVTAANLTSTGARVAGRAAENIGVALPAKLLGVQTADVKQAVSAGRRGSPEFVEQLTGQGAVTDPIVKAQNAVSELYAQRSKDYQRRMKRLKKSEETLAFDDVEAAIEGVRTVGRHKGVDISSASDVWDKVDAKYMEFFDKGLNTIEDFDAMKRSISNIRDTYQRGTPQYKVANDVVKSINDTIVAKAPIYADIMNDYRMASDTLADVQSSLSLGAKSQDVVLSKLRRNAGGRTPRGTTVLDLLEGTKSGKGLGDTIAAQNLSGTEPSGVAASMGAVGGVTMADPTLMAASATSPRAFGQMAYRAGEGLRFIDKSTEAMAGLPGAQKLGELAQRYAEPAAQTLRVANPIIQAQVDPFEGIPEEQKKALIEAYSASAPTFGPAQTDQIRLEDLASTYTGPVLSDATLQGLNGTYEDVDATGRVIDPLTGLPIAEEEAAEGFKRGGMVKGYNRGGTALRDRARSVGQGVTFGFGDELEGGVRALGRAISEGDLMALQQKYLQERDMVRAQQKAYEDANPIESLLYEGGGAMLTGLVPGAQGATAARMAQLAARSPKAARAAAVAADTALYGAGAAESVRDIPRSIRDEALFAVPMYGGAEGVRMGVNRYRARKGKKR
jgi:hypothetical protein